MAVQNSPARGTIDVGSVIAGTYTIEALIGRGGMGAVFLASHARLPGKKVAIKVLHAEMSGEEIDARFKREAQIASMLSHPNIVHIEDYNVTADGMPYLVLEYLQGESLAQRIRRGPLSVEQATSIIRQVGSALAAAHAKGIVHRDLKPQNIFLVPTELEGRTIEIAKVLDFGISKMRDSQTVRTQDSALLGTPQYMAPEQALGQHSNVDERTDVFALGAIVYEMLAGQPAFSGASIPEVVFKVVYEPPAPLAQVAPSAPAAVAAAVHRAMAKPAAERFANVSGFVEALTGQPLTLARPSITSIQPPDVGFATGSKNTGGDAFAQTMGSGDHAAPVEPLVRGSAPTVDSQNRPLPAPVAVAGPGPGPVEKKRTGLAVAGLVGAVVVSVVVVFAMKGESGKKPENAKAEPQAVVPAPVETEARTEKERPTETETETGTGTGTGTGTETGKVEKKMKVNPPKDEDEDVGGDETDARKLKESDGAMRAGQWQRAEQLANAVSTSEQASPRQRAKAFMIHGMVQCIGRNNEETAQIDLRMIKVPLFRRRLLAACHKAGFLRGDN